MKLFIPLLLICFSFGCKKPEKIAEHISESKPTIQLKENPTDFYEKLSNAAAMEMALASPIPLNCMSWETDIFPNVFRLFSEEAKMR